MTKPNFSEMNGAQLLEAFNMYAVSKRRAKFDTIADGIKRCESEYALWLKRQEEAANEAQVETAEAAGQNEEADMAKTAVKTKAAKGKAPKVAKTAKAKTKAPAEGRGRKRAGEFIKILTEGKANPRREGTAAHKHFEAMKKHPKVADYLDQFQDRKTAGQWLWNTVRDGHVELSDSK